MMTEQQPKYKYALLMIVKDEEPIIERALNSLKNLFDYYCICDTGSTDKTIEVIKQWGEANNKPGEVIQKEWKNFGFNKSYLFEHAYKTLNGVAEFFTFLDADEVFITDPANVASYLTVEDVARLYQQMKTSTSNIFNIMTLFGGLKYQRWNFVRNNQLYKWQQPVHEYLEGTVDGATQVIDWVYNLARKEGNSSRNPDRYAKDANMFLEFLQDHPNEPRATFYLAQTYESLDRTKALEYYIKRMHIDGGFYQERYIAALRAGRITEKYEDKIKHWLYGQTIVPHRLECLFEIMLLEYNRGKHQQVVGYGMMVHIDDERDTKRSFQPHDLFVEADIYDYKFDFYFAISCFYAKEFERGRYANSRAVKCAPAHIAQRIQDNLKFFPAPKSNHQLIQQSIQSNNIFAALNPTIDCNLIVIDNFYSDPYAVRDHALQQTFDVTGNYPGFRTGCQHHVSYCANVKQRFESILNRSIGYWPDGYNSSFQYATAEMNSWIHRDRTEWSAIIYLTPDAPLDAGTMIYRHKPSKKEKVEVEGDEQLLNHDTYDSSKWEIVDQVANKFNRCVLFKGSRNHISGTYFGTNKYDGRLFQMYFFNTK